MPIYVYKCPGCGAISERLREREDVYDDIICDHCGEQYGGYDNKLVESGITVTYTQGSLKGNM